MPAHSTRENEIKLPLASAAEGLARLKRGGFRVSRRRVFESNAVYDTGDLKLRRSGCLLRVRQAGAAATLTFKGRPEESRHKTREELEVAVSDAASMGAIAQRLGLIPIFRYEKYRTEYRRRGEPGMATLDETPIGAYLELEGPPEWVDATAVRLGFSEADYITASYATLYVESCRRRGAQPAHMVFDAGSIPDAAPETPPPPPAG